MANYKPMPVIPPTKRDLAAQAAGRKRREEGLELKAMRLRAGLSQGELAEFITALTGIPARPQQICRWETGRTSIPE